MSDFVHLHNHTHYSLQDAACTVEDLVKAAVKEGMHAVALTDHGVMYGIAEFYKTAKKENIKPIIGMEAYIVIEGSRRDKTKIEDASGKKSKHYHHLILLAKNKTGYKNLSKLSTLGHTEGFYYKPRIDLELLRKYSEGLIATSACAGGVVAPYLINGDFEKAKSVALTYKEIFGDDFYLEIQDHGLEFDLPILEGMPKLAKELNIKLVATNDCHYIKQEHAEAHNILLYLSDKTGEVNYKQLRYRTNQFYFKSIEEMKKLFKKYNGAVENTLEITEKINLEFGDKEYFFPQFPIPENSPAKNLDEYFELLAKEGLNNKIKDISPEVLERFEFEINTIKSMGFAGYFLITQDFINAAKSRNIPVGPGRGSVAGSLVAYTLGITDINPLPYGLLFERFLNPARKSMPDIDVDFADDQRGEIIEYVRQKYGSHCVSQIITFNKLSSKAVIRDVARVLKIPLFTVNKITKFIPSKFGKVYTIDEAIKEVAELKWLQKPDEPIIAELIKHSKTLEGKIRGAGKHAAGVVITPGDVSDYVPLANAVNQTEIVTQYNMNDIEGAGLLKMDFLGLRTLTIIRDTIKLIKKNHGVEINIKTIPLDDEKTFQLFSKGQTTGIFQFESPPMREYLKRLKPTSVSDLSAMNALYRPGPMEFIDDFIDRKYGNKKVEYLHSVLEEILKETYGVIVYQEQVIQIANKVAGMSLAEADILRRAMGKKDLKSMKEQKEKFVKGSVQKGISEKIAGEIFDAIDKFANYGFNKSHSVAYSIVAYQTAFLKAHYTPEFLAANLTNEVNDTSKITTFLDDCRKLKIEVMPPDVNNPTVFFDVEKGKIRFGMAAIKNVGKNAVEEIARARTENGKNFKSMFELCIKSDTRIVNKRVLEGLVLAGAFDSINNHRAQLFESIENALEFSNKMKNSKLNAETSLFGEIADEVQISEPELPNVRKWNSTEQLSRERKIIGFYISDHPLRKFDIEYRSFSKTHLGETETLNDNENVVACGVINELSTKIDKSGKTMAFFRLDDFSGSCECLMFSKVYEKFGKYLKDDEIIFIRGKSESSGDAIKIHIDEVFTPEEARTKMAKSLMIYVDPDKCTQHELNELNKILQIQHGNLKVFLQLRLKGRTKVYKLKYNVNVSNGIVTKISDLFGDDSIFFYTR